MKRRLITAIAAKKYLSPTNSFQTKSIIYKANINCDFAGYKEKCYLSPCETRFKDRFGITKSRSTTLNINKNDTEV